MLEGPAVSPRCPLSAGAGRAARPPGAPGPRPRLAHRAVRVAGCSGGRGHWEACLPWNGRKGGQWRHAETQGSVPPCGFSRRSPGETGQGVSRGRLARAAALGPQALGPRAAGPGAALLPGEGGNSTQPPRKREQWGRLLCVCPWTGPWEVAGRGGWWRSEGTV